MKTYIYYSKSNNAVEAVIASSVNDAVDYLFASLKARCVMITGDYVLMTTANTEGLVTGFNIE